MALVQARPFLEYLVGQLRKNGFHDIVLCAGFMAESVRDHFGDGSSWGVRLSYSVEPEPIGTAGTLKLAEPYLVGERWLLMNGDSLFDIPLRALLDEHDARPARATIALARVPDAGRYGRVTLDGDGVITGFVEKTDIATPGLINSGIYIIERSLLASIPADRPASLERDVIPPLIGSDLRGAEFDAYFIDIGVPSDYERAQRDTQTFEALLA